MSDDDARVIYPQLMEAFEEKAHVLDRALLHGDCDLSFQAGVDLEAIASELWPAELPEADVTFSDVVERIEPYGYHA